MLLERGCYPASVTLFGEEGEIDYGAMAKLLAWFESRGCAGVVLAGTNGEGPSLSAVEKRDLLRAMAPVRGRLLLIQGIATASLSEAIWSCRQAARDGAAAALLMAPNYFREATADGIVRWFRKVLDEAGLPVLLYNFPQRTGITITPEMVLDLSDHPNLAGIKDSSGIAENLSDYGRALPGKLLFVGNETLLVHALDSGWAGTISGAANLIPGSLARVVELHASDPAQAELRFKLALSAIEAIRRSRQPWSNKEALVRLGIVERSNVRLPLLPGGDVQEVIESIEGLR